MNDIGSASRGISGAHIATFFKGDPELFGFAVPFVIDGLERGEKVVYVLHDHTEEQVLDQLMKVKDVQGHLDAHTLLLAHSKDTYLKDGRFDVDRNLAFFRRSENEALAEGFTGLRATGETGWVPSGAPGVELLREYEARINRFYPGSTANLLCQYYEPDFDSEVLFDILRAHPRVVMRGEMCHNPYFLSTDELLAAMHGKVPKGLYDRIGADILKRTHLASIHAMELKDFRRARMKLDAIGGTALDDILSQVSIVDFYAELALEHAESDLAREYLGRISRNCDLVAKRIDMMRTYQLVARTEFRWWSLAEIVDVVGERLGQEGIEVDAKVSGCRVWAEGLFDRALEAIISCIPDLTRGTNKVTVQCSELWKGMLLSIEHKGRGVPDDSKSMIFDLGQTYGSSDGFGLFLAKEILSSSGMSIKETGTYGKETRFEILVPEGKYSRV